MRKYLRNKEKIIGSIMIVTIFAVFLLFGYIKSNSNSKVDDIFVESGKSSSEDQNQNTVSTQKSTQDSKLIVVQIMGEINKPGVYSMPSGSRVEDLIQIAGGITEMADMNKIINKAKKLKDEDALYIPKKIDPTDNAEISKGHVTASSQPTIVSSNNENEKIDINTATKEELMKVPGIGEVTSNNIIQYREKNGDFASMEELKKVGRIGDITLAKFKERLEVR